jgi:dihydrofolate reductase
MRRIITTTFLTLDGVYQAPGGPEEYTSGGFAHGGWSFGYWDEVMDKTLGAFLAEPFELLLGRRTYDIFAAFWPKTDKDPEVAKPFNETRKYVISRSTPALAWQNSTLITGDVISQLRRLKEDNAPDLWVHGSGDLIQTLLQHALIDRMHLWTFPVTAGSGKRLFCEGTPAASWKVTDSLMATSGVVIATYEPAGEIKKGSFAD